jgi:hypothetical protein
MTHHATNLDLPGEANITTAAGDVAVFQSTGANTVQCISYTKADGTAISGATAITSAISVKRSGNQSINDNTETKVQFNSETYDVDSEYDAVTNYRFTATNTGKYLCIIKVNFASITAGQTCFANFRVNGSSLSPYMYTKVATGVTDDTDALNVHILNLSASDYVEGWCWHNNGDAVNARSHSYMHIHRLS